MTQLDFLTTAQPIIATRTRLGRAEDRHLALLGSYPGTGRKGTTTALCGHDDQENCGAGLWRYLVKWPTCETCRRLAVAMGPHPSQERAYRPKLRQFPWTPPRCDCQKDAAADRCGNCPLDETRGVLPKGYIAEAV